MWFTVLHQVIIYIHLASLFDNIFFGKFLSVAQPFHHINKCNLYNTVPHYKLVMLMV